MKKRCSRCGREKELDEFHKCSKAKDGLAYRCKECSRRLWKGYYEKNKNYLLEKDKLRAIVNPEKERRRRKKYKSRPEVREHYRIWWKGYSKGRLSKEPLYAFKMWVRRETRRAAISKTGNIHSRLQPLLGCSQQEFKEHLEKTWLERYGKKWDGEPFEIDHVIPLSSATTKEHMAELCHYKNVQMLTPEDNRKKGIGNNSILEKDKV